MRQPPRKLTVLVSIDVAGYTRLVQHDERGTLGELAAIRRDILDPLLATHNGDMFKTMGDGGLIEFPSVEDSVRWAIDFQTAMAEHNKGRGANAIKVRVAVALADVVIADGDRYGAAVAFVGAAPGGLAAGRRRHHALGAVAAPQGAARQVQRDGAAHPQEHRRADRGVVLDAGRRESPVVGPSAQGRAEAGGAGGTADRQAVDRGAGVRHPVQRARRGNRSGTASSRRSPRRCRASATSRSSRATPPMSTRARPTTCARSAARSASATCSKGSVRKRGNDIRVTAQLIDAETGTHVWADTYHGIAENIFALRGPDRRGGRGGAPAIDPRGGDRAGEAQAAGKPGGLRSRAARDAASLGQRPCAERGGDPPARPGGADRPQVLPRRGDGGLGAGAAGPVRLGRRSHRRAARGRAVRRDAPRKGTTTIRWRSPRWRPRRCCCRATSTGRGC